MSLTFAHQAAFDELSLPAEGFEEVSKNDVAVIAMSSMVPSDTPAGKGPTERILQHSYLRVTEYHDNIQCAFVYKSSYLLTTVSILQVKINA